MRFYRDLDNGEVSKSSDILFNNLYSSTTQQTDTDRQTDRQLIQLTNTTNTKLKQLQNVR